MPQTILKEEPVKERKKRVMGAKSRVLTAEQLILIIKQYNQPGPDGIIKTVKNLAAEMGVSISLINEGINWLRKANAKLNHARKDEHYKLTIKALQRSNPELFEKK